MTTTTASRTDISEALPRNKVIIGDATSVLASLPESSVDCVVCSPPYHLLRRYQAGPDEIGTEPTVDEYVAAIVAVGVELARVLKPSGSWWLNLGDSYSRGQRYGAAPKSLLLAPERILLALAESGWIVRNKIVWAKPNPMPASVTDRFTATWEPVFLLTRSRHYFFDLDVIRQPHKSRPSATTSSRPGKYGGTKPVWAGPLAGTNSGLVVGRAEGRPGHPLGKNPGDVWTIPTARFGGAHFAVYPEGLVQRPILAGCPERVCTPCGQPWLRERRRDRLGSIAPTCDCHAGWRPGLVLDPFFGAGTTGVAATRLGRDWLGVELNADYARLAEKRIDQVRARSRDPPRTGHL